MSGNPRSVGRAGLVTNTGIPLWSSPQRSTSPLTYHGYLRTARRCAQVLRVLLPTKLAVEQVYPLPRSRERTKLTP
jgi:hypothetical protein